VFHLINPSPPRSTLFPYTTLFRSPIGGGGLISGVSMALKASNPKIKIIGVESSDGPAMKQSVAAGRVITLDKIDCIIDGLRVKRSEEHTSELQSRGHLVCRLLLEK